MRRKLFTGLTIIALLAAAAWALHSWISLDEIIAQEHLLRNEVRDHPLTAAALGFVTYTLLLFVPGLAGKALIVGWLYGFVPALIIVNLGMTTVAMVSFLLGRLMFRRYVHRRHGELLQKIDAGLQHEGVYYLVAARLLHFPFTLMNYSLGATNVRIRTFWWTTQLGLLPANAVIAYAGAQLPTLRTLTEKGMWQLLTPELIAAMAALSFFPLALAWAVRRVRHVIRDRRCQIAASP